MLLQAAELRLQDTDSLREHQQQELSSKLLVAEGALATMKEELGAQASRHAEELQRLEASLETASAARQDLQHQLDTATERVQQLETELKARYAVPAPMVSIMLVSLKQPTALMCLMHTVPASAQQQQMLA